jgi:hypothetical protein
MAISSCHNTRPGICAPGQASGSRILGHGVPPLPFGLIDRRRYFLQSAGANSVQVATLERSKLLAITRGQIGVLSLFVRTGAALQRIAFMSERHSVVSCRLRSGFTLRAFTPSAIRSGALSGFWFSGPAVATAGALLAAAAPQGAGSGET